MTLSYVDHGGAVAVSTAASPAYPTTVVAGDILVYYVASDSATMPTTLSGWTALSAPTRAGGITSMAFLRIASGGETGTVTLTGITGGTKGWADIIRSRSNVPGATILADVQYGSDSTATTTTLQAVGGSWTVQTGDLLIAPYSGLAATGSFTASPSAVSVSHTVATVSSTAAFGSRTGSNTIGYGAAYAPVTAGGTGVPTINGTFTGANVGGTGAIVRLRESVSTPATVNAVVALVSISMVVAAPSTSQMVEAVVSPVAVSALTPVVSVSMDAVVSAVVAAGSVQAGVPAVTGSATVGAVVAFGAVVPGVPVVGASGQVVASTGIVGVVAGVPAVTASASVGAVRAQVTASAIAPVVQVGASGLVSAPVATITSASSNPFVSAGAQVQAVAGQVQILAHIAQVTAGLSATIEATPATVTISAPAPDVTGATSAVMFAVAAAIIVATYSPAVTGGTGEPGAPFARTLTLTSRADEITLNGDIVQLTIRATVPTLTLEAGW